MAGLRKPFKGSYPLTQVFGRVGLDYEPAGWRRVAGGAPWQASYVRPTESGWTFYKDLHFGTDWDCPGGTELLAMEKGKVVDVGFTTGRGRYVVVRIDGTDCRYRFQHLRQALVKVGDAVERGQVIALSGNTGVSTGSHLHVEIWRGSQGSGVRYNPTRLMVGGDKADVAWIKPK